MSPRPRHARIDEEDVRVRPGRGSRPRTRRRPAHADAVDGLVIAVDRGRFRCWVGGRRVTAMKARELGRGTIVVGDMVSLAGEVTGAPGTLARVVRVAPRRTVLRRSADDADPVERVIVANADQLVIVCSLADPPPRVRLIDRFLVAAYDAGIEPVLCLTKSDLAGPERILAAYQPLGLRCLVVGRPLAERALAPVRSVLAGRVSVLVGHSGVGKSTLVNALVPEADRAVGAVSPATGRGRHTSSSVIALPLPGGPPGARGGPGPGRPQDAPGWIIDTPGLRGFGLGHLSAQRVARAFPDLAAGAANCPPGCDHLAPGCALDGWAAAGPAPLAARLDSLRRLLRSREGADDTD